jgi:predicted nucleic-acid-binding protein
LRLVTGDEERQAAVADEFIKEGAWVSQIALVETIWALRSVYGLSLKQQADAVEMLLGHKSLILQDSETVTAALSLFRTRPALLFSDCLIMETARKAGHLPLGTFDRAFARTDGAQRL